MIPKGNIAFFMSSERSEEALDFDLELDFELSLAEPGGNGTTWNAVESVPVPHKGFLLTQKRWFKYI